MLAEVPDQHFSTVLDSCAAELLWEAGVAAPPVDAMKIAAQLGLLVAHDAKMACRARFVRLGDPFRSGAVQETIVVGPSERPERMQWAVAHEIGESVAYRVFDSVGLPSDGAPPGMRESVANLLASRLLLPVQWFTSAANELDWDLPSLKRVFSTASHELIASRMLDMTPSVVITVCDQRRVHWRRGNAASGVPSMHRFERDVWQRVHRSGRDEAVFCDDADIGLERVACWAIHEPGWKREILRSEVSMW